MVKLYEITLSHGETVSLNKECYFIDEGCILVTQILEIDGITVKLLGIKN